MDDDRIWEAIDFLRGRTADMLDDLTGDEWDRPSLCEGWTVRDVAAHLTLQQITIAEGLKMVVRNPASVGNINRFIERVARGKASAVPPAGLITEMRSSIGSKRHNIGVSNMETLIDALVHEQDIAIPLGRELPMPRAAAASAATRVLADRGGWKSRVFKQVSLDAISLHATDVDWSAGTGRVVEGPISAILLVLTGRRVGQERLRGDGAESLSVESGWSRKG